MLIAIALLDLLHSYRGVVEARLPWPRLASPAMWRSCAHRCADVFRALARGPCRATGIPGPVRRPARRRERAGLSTTMPGAGKANLRDVPLFQRGSLDEPPARRLWITETSAAALSRRTPDAQACAASCGRSGQSAAIAAPSHAPEHCLNTPCFGSHRRGRSRKNLPRSAS